MEILINGAIISAIYAMLAVGFTLVFGVARVLNLAHGAFYTMGAYSYYLFAVMLNLPLLLSAALSIGLTSMCGWGVERLLIQPQRSSTMAVMMVTLAFSLVVEQGIMVTFGAHVINVPGFVDSNVRIGNVDVSGQQLLTLVVAVVTLGLVAFLINRTRGGSAVLAISQDPIGARYMGIPVDRIYGQVAALAAGLAALAGVLAGPFLSVSPHMGLPALTKAFAIVIVGGLGSLPGSIMAAFLLGYTETIVAYLISSSWTEVVSLVAVLLTLLLLPSGLRGRRAAF